MASCRRKKDDATFLEVLKDHIDEFIYASMEEPKTCFQKTISKMFGLYKNVAEQNSKSCISDSNKVESVLPLEAITSAPMKGALYKK